MSTREVVFEVISTLMELSNHVINLPNMTLQVVLLLLDPLVPYLCKQAFNVRLGLARI